MIKSFTFPSATFAALAISAMCYAVDYSSEQLDHTGSNLFNQGIQIAGSDFGGAFQFGTVNGVDFSIGNVLNGMLGDIGDRNDHADVTYFEQPDSDPELKEIMDDIVFTAGSLDPSVTFSGLTAGTSYVAQFLSWDADVENEGTPGVADKELRNTIITSSIDGDSHVQRQFVTGDGSTRDQIFPVITTASFIANDSTVVFNFGLDPTRPFDDNAILNAATLFEAELDSSNGDFNNDGVYDCTDVDRLVAEIAAGSNEVGFDLTDDGQVNNDDLTAWLAEAGAENLGSGNPYLRGDINLDGFVDVADFNVWNGNKFTANPAWCRGDLNADGSIDVGDFNMWNGNKFTSSGVNVVPEPAAIALVIFSLSFLCFHQRSC